MDIMRQSDQDQLNELSLIWEDKSIIGTRGE
jgi:hypothetical protein